MALTPELLQQIEEYTQDGTTLDIGDGTIVEEVFTDTTFRIDWENKRIGGKIDGKDALKQAAELILSVNLDDDGIIYPHAYGLERNDLFGRDLDWARAMAAHQIETALLRDDRFHEVRDLQAAVMRPGKIIYTLTLTTAEGDAFEMERLDEEV